MTRSVLVVAFLAILSASTSGQSESFDSWFSATMTTDSIWRHCELEILVDEEAKGVARINCGWNDETKTKAERKLTAQEVSELRSQLRQINAFEGQSWGRDHRGIDAALVTLTVSDQGRIAVLVTSSNPTFDKGPRRLFLDFLTRLHREMTDNK